MWAYKKIQVGGQRRGQTVRVIINGSVITILMPPVS